MQPYLFFYTDTDFQEEEEEPETVQGHQQDHTSKWYIITSSLIINETNEELFINIINCLLQPND